MTILNEQIALTLISLWIGFVSAISFMESWIKFKAPGITLPLGLGIGKLVYYMLNKIEWLFAILLFINLGNSLGSKILALDILIIFPVVILITQSICLLPILNVRAQMQMNGKILKTSNIHLYYFGCEIVKVISLCSIGLAKIFI